MRTGFSALEHSKDVNFRPRNESITESMYDPEYDDEVDVNET